MKDSLSGTLQENLLTLLAYDDEAGRIISHIVSSSLFEGDYRIIAERCIDYWRRQRVAPKDHTPDLLSDILENPDNRRAKTYQRILTNMLDLSENINTKYVLDSVKVFVRGQHLKEAVLRSAELINTREELAISDIETLWHDLLRTREIDFEPGLTLQNFDEVLDFMNSHYVEFKLGIDALDRKMANPYRQAVMLLLGPTGAGKSWFLVHAGKHALLQRKKVLHISLEMSEHEVAQRYYQSIFSIPKTDGKLKSTIFELDEDGR